MRSAKWLAVLAALVGGLGTLQGLSGCAVSAPVVSAREGPQSQLPFDLKTEYASQPLGLDEPQPRFSWRLPDGAARQSAYRIRVATSASALESGVLWDSGRVASGDTAQIAYQGPALQSRTRYEWQVQVWDGRGHASGWSAPSWWEMGLLQPDDWSAQWISGRTTLDHDWHDARIRFDFTLTGSSVGFLFRAKPVGKTYGEAYLWRIMKVGGAMQLVEQVRRYPGGSSPNVAVRTLHAQPIVTGKDWAAHAHQLVIDTHGKTLKTTLDGVLIGSVEDDAEASGTIGFIANEPNAAIIHAVSIDSAVGSFHTDFSDGINPFTGGSLVAGGLQVAAGVPDKDLVLPIAAPAPLLRHAFALAERPVSARLYVAVGGFADLSLNGQRIGHSLQDGYTDYDKRVLYRSFDVSDAMLAGDNVIAAELGRGWYGVTEPNEWYWHMAPWHAAPTLRAQLELHFADGRTQRIVTDDSWRSSDGPTRHDSVYGGERYDARLEQKGWRKAGFDDGKWQAANVVGGPKGALHAAMQEPIAAVGEIAPQKISEPKPGVFVYDFGRIFAGRLQLHVRGPRGTTLRMTQTEKLNDDGTVAIVSGLVDAQLQTDQYTLAGDGDESWTPRFGYKGFRYVQLEGFPGTPTLDTLRGEIVHSAVASAGNFESSNELLNQIQQAARNTILNNMHGNQTDTPTYEKNGWTGDAQASSLASALNFDVARVWTKWLADFRDSQSDKGEIPEIVPSTPYYGYEQSPGWNMVWGPLPSWDAATFVLPWELYERSGDRRILERMYDTQKRLVDYTGTFFSSEYKYANPNNPFLGEYASAMPPGGLMAAIRLMPAGPVDATASAYYLHMLDLQARSAALLGKTEDAATYRALAEKVRVAYNARYWNADEKRYGSVGYDGKPRAYAQTQNVLPVAFGIVPDGMAAEVMRQVNDDIVAHDHHLTTGVYAGRYVMTLLSDYGYADTAYQVATSTDYPSWGFWIKNGLSTMAEGWELSSRSWDHHYWASISSYFYQSLAGIRPAAAGYTKLTIKPMPPAGLQSVRATLETEQGTVLSSWHHENGRFTLDVTIPRGAEAEVWVPSAKGKLMAVPSGAHFLRREEDRSVYRVAAGEYCFEAMF